MAVKILVLEDDPDMRAALADVLLDQGYEVVAVERGHDAVARAREEAFDLIVSDIRMEGMSGLDTIEELKKDQPDLGALVVSGWASEEETLRAVRLNVGGYLKKPFSMDEFLETVQQLLQKSRAAQQSDLLERALAWAVSTLGSVVDRSALLGPAGNLQWAADFATRLARRCGLGEGQARELGLLTHVLQLQQLLEFPDWLLQERQRLPWLARLEETDGLPFQIANLALELAPQSDALPGELSLELSPALRQAYEDVLREASGSQSAQASPEVLHGLKDPARVQRSLLNLARTLQDAGDLDSAQSAYEQVAGAEISRESVQASLGLAGLGLQRGQPAQVAHWCAKVAQLAQHLGPVSYASALFECGLLHYLVGSEQARALLEQAALAQSRVGLAVGQAQSCLLLCRLGSPTARAWLPQALEILNDPTYGPELAGSTWMLKELLELGADPELEGSRSALYRLPLSQSRSLHHVLPSVSRAARAGFVKTLEGAGKTLPGDVLTLLEQDPDGEVRATAERLRRNGGASVSAPPVGLQLLGFFEVFRGDERVGEGHWKTQKFRFLLAFLASHVGRLVPEDQVLEEFWPDDLVRGKRSLYSGISIIRRLLRPPVEGPIDYDYVVRDKDNIGFNWALPHYCDLEQLELALQQAHKNDTDLAPLRRVAQLYVAPYLDGSYLDWALRRREDLEERVLRALCRLSWLLCQQKLYHEALEHSSRAVTLAPHAQEAHLLKMRSLLGLNQPDQVLKQFASVEKMLRKEYGLEPNTELIEISLRARHGLPDIA